MSEFDDLNQQVIKEFRESGGNPPSFQGWPLLILHHNGRRSGTARLSPLVYQQVGAAFAVFGSRAGADESPDWYLNLLAHPDTTIEIGDRTVSVHARHLPAEERDPIWEKHKKEFPNFAEYEAKTSRRIPVVLLERVG